MKKQVKLNETNTVNHKFLKPRALTLMLLFMALIMGGVSTVSAADGDMIYVNGTGGSDDNNGISWQYAKQSIKNATGTVNSNGTVHIANGTYKGSNNRDITINKSMNIIGQSQSGTIIDAEGLSRIFLINPGVDVTINKLTLANGYHASYGGAIRVYNGSTLDVIGSTFTGSTASNYGGAIYNDGTLDVSSSTFTVNNASRGGAIYNDGTLDVIGSTFTGSTASNYGGAIYNTGTLNVSSSTFTGSTANFGGVIYNTGGTLNVGGSTFTNNTAKYYSAVIYNTGTGTGTVIGSTFTGNNATSGGAIGAIYSSGTVSVIGSTFAGNNASYGGAIYSNGNLVVIGSTFAGNNASYGGAIYNTGGTAEVHFSRIVGNTASQGNAIYRGSGSVNVENNWWGSNINPKEISNLIMGDVDADSWLVLTVTAYPNLVSANGNSIITADLLHDSNGAYHDPADGHVPDGTSVQLSATLGAIPSVVTTSNGKAEVTFAAGGTKGLTTIQATIDNETQTTRVNIGKDDLYVSPTGNDETGNGSSQYPFQTIGKAIAEVSSNGIVHLLNGTYKGSNNRGITINRSMNIIGQSQSGTIIDAEGLSRIFLINPGVNVTINKLTLANGYNASYGGAIDNAGNLTVSGSTFTGNTAGEYGGAINSYGNLIVNSSTFQNNTATYGGAIFNYHGTLNVNRSTFTENKATGEGSGGGAIINFDGTLNVTGSTFTGNTAKESGGAIGSDNSLTVSGSTFTGNTAEYGGAIANEGNLIVNSSNFQNNTANYGGAIYNHMEVSNSTVSGSTFTGNKATWNGGAIYIYNDSTLNVSGSTFTNNTATYDAGAIYNEGNSIVNSSTFTNNHAGDEGGAIYNNNGSIKVEDSTFNDNTADYIGGAIYLNKGSVTVNDSTFTNNTAKLGGAILNNGGTLNVKDSAFTGNTATSLGGGAIHNTGYNNVNVSGSTFTGNKATGSTGNGGAIYNTSNTSDGVFNVDGSTFTGNSATSSGGAIYNRRASTFKVQFSRIIGNTASEGQDIYFEPQSYVGKGSVNASYNWWGSNNGPSSGRVSENVTVGPWLVLTVTAHPAIIPANGKSTITADFLHDSNGASVRGHVPDGIPVTFTAVNGTVNPESSTLFGSTTSTFTATTGGAVKFAATVDNQTVSTTSTALDPVSNFAGQNVNLTANVTDVNGDPVNEGQVQFIVNNQEIGTSTVSNGKATFNWKIPDDWSVGNYNVVVNYWGTVNYHVSSGAGTLTVTRTPTNITVNTANGHAGHDVNLTANVTDINGNPVNEGQVHFTVNGITVGSAPVDENGIATFNGWSIPSKWSLKQYNIIAKYLGTANFSVSESTGNLTVDYISTSLTVDPARGSKGDSINLTAKLWDNLYNKPVKGKQVDFYVNDVKKGSGTTDKNGVATYKYTLTQDVGKYTINAVFDADTQYANADGINTLSIIDKTAPTIVSVNPANGATKVAANKTIKVTFSEEIKTGSLWIELKNSTGKAISFNHTISGKVLTIKPISNLSESLYTLIIHTGAVTDLAGNPVALKSTKFSVGDSPKIISTNPKNSATNVDTGKNIEVTFNENIKKGNNWIELKNSDGKSVSFTKSISGKVLTIKPKIKLAESKYKLILHTGAVTDTAGNPLALKSFTFTTGTPPTITKTDPKNNAVNIARNKTIKVTFNENIKAGSNYWIELVDKNGAKIAIKKSIKGKVLTITHTAKLKANTKYYLKIHTGAVTDTAGNPLALKTINFTTRT